MDARQRYLRPITLCVIAASFFELLIFVIFGLWLFPEGNILNKFLWSVVFCGVGMGSATGWLISVLVVDRLQGIKAIGVTALISLLVLGIACNLLCLGLDQHFNYFGSHEMPLLFWLNGIVMSALGGVIVGWLLFTQTGLRYLDKFRF